MRSRPKSLESRLNLAATKAQGALDIFRAAADELDQAADTALAVANEADDEVVRLRTVRESAHAEALNNQTRADKIRSLLQ